MDQLRNNLGERYQQMLTGINVGSSQALESTGGRIQSFEAGWKICKENWLIGVGIGDEQSALQKEFREQNFTYASHHKLNCHNQFLQTWLATGIFGLFILIVLVLLPLILNPSILSFGFSVLLILNLLVESMLERQIGLFFFTFFYLLLLQTKEKQSYPSVHFPLHILRKK
jgi:O-antigen ligase